MLNINDQPLSVLELPIKIENTLIKKGVNTLGDISQREKIDLLKIKQIGPKALDLIAIRLLNFFSINNIHISLGQEKDRNDISKVLFILREKILSYDNKNVQIKQESNLSKKLINNKSTDDLSNYKYWNDLFDNLSKLNLSERESFIFNYRLRFFTKSKSLRTYSLEEISQLETFLVTRERVRQIEARMLKKIERTIYTFNLNNLASYERLLVESKKIFEIYKIIKWFDDCENIANKLDFNTDKLTNKFAIFYFERFLFKTVDCKRYEFEDVIYRVFNATVDIKRIKKSLDKIKKYLHKHPYPSVLEKNLFMLTKVNDKNFTDLDIRMLQLLISQSSGYSHHPGGKYVKKNQGVIEYAYQILQTENKPLHFQEVTRKVQNLSLIKYSPRTVMNAMIRSPLFHGIGNGKYALSKWGFKKYRSTRHEGNLSVKSLVENYLKDKGPSFYLDISKFVKEKREASDYTIRQTLNGLGCYQDYQKHYYWRDKKKLSLSDIISECLTKNGASSFKDILKFVRKYKNFSKSNIYTSLNKMGCYIDSFGIYHISSNKKQEITKKITIRSMLETYLNNNEYATLEDIYNDLSNKRKVSHNTIKSYLSSMGLKQDISGAYQWHKP